MKRLKATTKTGRRCLNRQQSDAYFCATNATDIFSCELLATVAGASVSHALIPGFGFILGGLAGYSF
jgi:hypothetical protein